MVSLAYKVGGFTYDNESVSASSFYDAALFWGTGYTAGTDATGNVIADFSSYSVSSSLPEPTGLGILCVGGVLFGLRRNRRAIANI